MGPWRGKRHPCRRGPIRPGFHTCQLWWLCPSSYSQGIDAKRLTVHLRAVLCGGQCPSERVFRSRHGRSCGSARGSTLEERGEEALGDGAVEGTDGDSIEGGTKHKVFHSEPESCKHSLGFGCASCLFSIGRVWKERCAWS